MNERNETEGGFRLSDWFLVLLLALCIAGMVFRQWSLRRGGIGELAVYTVTAEWRDVDSRTADCLSEGEWLRTGAGELFGQVVRVERLPAAVRLSEGGQWYEGTWPDEARCGLVLTLSVQARESQGLLLRGGTHPLNTGETYLLYSGRAELRLFVRSYVQNQDVQESNS